MSSRINNHVRSNLIGYLALFVALSGTVYAADKIGSKDIKTGAVKSKQIADDGVKSKDIRDDKGVKSRDVKDGSLGPSDINLTKFPLRLNVPPTSWVSAGIPDADVTYFIGLAKVDEGAGGAGFRNLHANVQVPNQIAGRRMELKSFELCYNAAASAVLSEFKVRTILSTATVPFSDTTVIEDETDRTDSTCRIYEPSSQVVLGPNEFIEPSVTINFTGASFDLHRSTVILEPV